MMALHRPPQLPIETLLRNSRQTAVTSRQRNSSEEYILEADFHTTVPASTSLSEHEVEQLLRQLKQYAGLYEDMLHNYQLLTKRLCAEDRRNSGNFSKKRANLPGTVYIYTLYCNILYVNVYILYILVLFYYRVSTDEGARVYASRDRQYRDTTASTISPPSIHTSAYRDPQRYLHYCHTRKGCGGATPSHQW